MNKPELPPEYPLGPALDFLQRIWQLNQALEKVSARMRRRIGVTAQQRMILRCLGKFPGLTATQLAALLHLDPGTISAALNRLEDKQLVERRRDPRDKRRSALGLSVKGRRLDRPAPGTVEHAVEALLGSTPERELAATLKVLQRFRAALWAELRFEAPSSPQRVRR